MIRLPFSWTQLNTGTRPCLLAAMLLAGVSAHPQNPAPLGELFPADTGSPQLQVVGTGMPVVAGSELSAGVAPARFRLNRGGQVRICPRTSVGVNSGTYGLMFSMGSGAVEVDYRMAPRSADVLLTPDLSVRAVGPGIYHFAVGVNRQGDTCFKSLPGDTSMVVLSELMGTGVYKAEPGQAVSFSGGKLNAPKPLAGDCGCPLPAPTMVASAPVPVPPKPASNGNPPIPGGAAMVANNSPTAPLPADQPGQVHIEVETPFVFNARSAAAVKPYTVARLNFSNLPNVLFLQEKVDPVVLKEMPAKVSSRDEPRAQVIAPGQKQEKKGFFGKVKGFFGSIFHH